jgi:hypothetical protein
MPVAHIPRVSGTLQAPYEHKSCRIWVKHTSDGGLRMRIF